MTFSTLKNNRSLRVIDNEVSSKMNSDLFLILEEESFELNEPPSSSSPYELHSLSAALTRA